MISKMRSSLTAVAIVLMAGSVFAETIIKLELGASGPDVQFADGEISTVNDGNIGATSPGDRDTDATFLGFVSDEGIVDIPEDASFTLSGINRVGDAVLFNSIVQQSTTGGEFELFDTDGSLILSGILNDGFLIGPSSDSGVSTGSLFSVELGSFTGPEGDNDHIFKLLKPDSAQLSLAFTNISNSDGQSGLEVVGGQLQGFTADAQALIEADGPAGVVPEPASGLLAAFALLGILGARRRR